MACVVWNCHFGWSLFSTLATGEQYDALTFANKKKFRAAGRCTLDKLD